MFAQMRIGIVSFIMLTVALGVIVASWSNNLVNWFLNVSCSASVAAIFAHPRVRHWLRQRGATKSRTDSSVGGSSQE